MPGSRSWVSRATPVRRQQWKTVFWLLARKYCLRNGLPLPGVTLPSTAVQVLDGGVGEMVFDLALAPGEARVLTFALAVAAQGGAAAARKLIQEALPRFETCWQTNKRFTSGCWTMVRGCTAQMRNSTLLSAWRWQISRCWRLRMKVWGAISSPGLKFSPSGSAMMGLTAGRACWQADSANHSSIMCASGSTSRLAGRVPHQISPSAQTAFAGNAQETALWVMSVWDAFRWTGDRAFLQELYPGAVQGLLDYTLGTIDPDGDGYPSGPGMVEVEGMGEEKLDSAAYAWAALKALAEMAAVLEDQPVWERALAWVDKIEANFEADWWDEPSGTYAMSLLQDNQRYPVPHWAVVVPLEVGLASPEHAAATFATLRASYLNAWGLKHTAGEDERVWTLPTATLSRAAYRYGERGLGFEMLHHVAETLRYGSTGMFHELIPEGACFIQLWSAATLIRGVVEDLLGIEVRADRGEIRAAPRLPADWQSARLENLSFGAWVVNVEVMAGWSVKVEQVRGPKPVVVLEN
jgi:hypothetical protein